VAGPVPISNREVYVTTVVRLIAVATAYFVGAVSSEMASAQQNVSMDGWHKVGAPSQMKYKIVHDRVTELSNISEYCEPPNNFSDFAGTIVKVGFADNGITITSIVLESEDGDRTYMNVDPVSIGSAGMNMVDLGWIVQGMQKLMRTNAHVRGSMRLCGAAGRFLVVDKIRLDLPRKPPQVTPPAPSTVPNGSIRRMNIGPADRAAEPTRGCERDQRPAAAIVLSPRPSQGCRQIRSRTRPDRKRSTLEFGQRRQTAIWREVVYNVR
jgi:hypothetical protein